MFSQDDIKNIKVEISLSELCDLKEKAEFYFIVSQERDHLSKEIEKLKQELLNIKQ